jgi:nitroreductase
VEWLRYEEKNMNRRTFLKSVPAMTMIGAASSSFAEDANRPAKAIAEVNTAANVIEGAEPIALIKPEMEGGKSVLAALKERRTIRSIKGEKLPEQTLSNLLWAAWGVNRNPGPMGRLGRTAASASNSQEIDLYVVMPEATYFYEAETHRLYPVALGDLRAKVSAHGRREALAKAPVILVYVVDIAKYKISPFQEPDLKDPEIQKSYYNVAVGLIAGNVYLFAASQGLAAWFHNCNKTTLAGELKLRPEQRVLFAQTVGFPA